MHEVALAQSIVDLVREEARRSAFLRATTVHLRIGALAGVEPDALRMGFDVAARGTEAEGARLAMESTPGTAVCAACRRELTVSSRLDDCPWCGSVQIEVTGGTELRVTELEVA